LKQHYAKKPGTFIVGLNTTLAQTCLTLTMKYLLPVLFALLLGCEAPAFKSDTRQIIALQKIESMLPHKSTGFAIESFKEDMVTAHDTTLAKSLTRYNFQMIYYDSSGALIRTQAIALFAPNGTSLLQAQIIPLP